LVAVKPIGHFLNSRKADLGGPELDGFSFGAGDALDQLQWNLWRGDIGVALLSILSLQF
jgi:hypothetical protein